MRLPSGIPMGSNPAKGDRQWEAVRIGSHIVENS